MHAFTSLAINIAGGDSLPAFMLYVLMINKKFQNEKMVICIKYIKLLYDGGLMCVCRIIFIVFNPSPQEIFLDTGSLPYAQWIQNILIINFWPHYMKGGRVYRTMGIREGEKRLPM